MTVKPAPTPEPPVPLTEAIPPQGVQATTTAATTLRHRPRELPYRQAHSLEGRPYASSMLNRDGISSPPRHLEEATSPTGWVEARYVTRSSPPVTSEPPGRTTEAFPPPAESQSPDEILFLWDVDPKTGQPVLRAPPDRKLPERGIKEPEKMSLGIIFVILSYPHGSWRFSERPSTLMKRRPAMTRQRSMVLGIVLTLPRGIGGARGLVESALRA